MFCGFRPYAIAKKTFEKNNIEALDYTINGKLQVFKKGKIKNNYVEDSETLTTNL